MPWLFTNRFEDVNGAPPVEAATAHEEAQQRAFGDRAGRQGGFRPFEPVECDVVMDVIGDGQCHEDVSVGKVRRHASSSSDRTSSAVTDRPIDTKGIPRGLAGPAG